MAQSINKLTSGNKINSIYSNDHQPPVCDLLFNDLCFQSSSRHVSLDANSLYTNHKLPGQFRNQKVQPVPDVVLVAPQKIKNRKNIISKLVYALGFVIAILFIIFLLAGALSKLFTIF